MANPIVLTAFSNPDPNEAPLNVTELVQLLNKLVQSAIVGAYVPYVIGHDTPSSNDQDKAWIALDTTGIPIGIFTYVGGQWRRVYNGMLGQIVLYGGNPNTDFDSTGLGLVGLWWDGWALCNGQNGTTDLPDMFIVGAHMPGPQPGGDGRPFWNTTTGFTTFVDQTTNQNKGGAAKGQITLDAAHTFIPPPPTAFVGQWSATGNTAGVSLYGVRHHDATDVDVIAGTGYPANTSPTPINVLPPFIAMGFAQFVGYT